MLIAGFNDDGRNWSSVTPSLAASTRVCWYSRFGTGDSDQPSTPQTFSSQAPTFMPSCGPPRSPGPTSSSGTPMAAQWPSRSRRCSRSRSAGSS